MIDKSFASSYKLGSSFSEPVLNPPVRIRSTLEIEIYDGSNSQSKNVKIVKLYILPLSLSELSFSIIFGLVEVRSTYFIV